MSSYVPPYNWQFPTNLANPLEFIRPMLECVIDSLVKQNPNRTTLINDVADTLGARLISAIASEAQVSSDHVVRMIGPLVIDVCKNKYPNFSVLRHPSGTHARIPAPLDSVLNQFTPTKI